MKESYRLLLNCLKIIATFVFLLGYTSLIAQSKLADDWEVELAEAKGQDRIELLVQLTEDLAKINSALADSLASEGIALAKQTGDSLSMYRIIANKGKIYYYSNEKEKGIEWTKKALIYFEKNINLEFYKSKYQLILASFYIGKRAFAQADSLTTESELFFKKFDNILWQSKALQTKGYLHWVKQEYEEAIRYHSEALEMCKDLDDIEHKANLMRSLGALNLIRGLYPEALELEFQVIAMDCSSFLKSKSYDDIGIIYSNLEDWGLAAKYITSAIELKKELGLESSLAYSLFSLGDIHYRQLNLGESLKSLRQCLVLSKKYNNDRMTGNTLGIIGNIYYELGKPTKANEYYDEQMELAKAQNDWEGVFLVEYNRGFYLHQAKEYNTALKHLLESLKIAEEKEHLPFLLKNYGQLTNTYDKLPGGEEKSAFYAKQYDLTEERIKSFKKVKKIGALEQEYTTKFQQDSLNSSNQKEASTGYDKEISSKLNITIGISLLILLLGVSFVLFKKNQEKELTSVDSKPLDQTKIEQYFEEIFTRLDKKNTAPESFKNQLSDADTPPINDMALFLKDNLSTPNSWASFEQYFEKIHKDFFKNLKTTYPNITVNELNMCALLKLNLRNKDIAQIMGIGHDSIRVAQNRLSKKIGLPTGVVLRDFILKM